MCVHIKPLCLCGKTNHFFFNHNTQLPPAGFVNEMFSPFAWPLFFIVPSAALIHTTSKLLLFFPFSVIAGLLSSYTMKPVFSFDKTHGLAFPAVWTGCIPAAASTNEASL